METLASLMGEMVEKVTKELLSLFKTYHAPKRLKDAMSYALFGNGKRIRPFLVLESARLFDVQARALSVAIALECMHCYSLIHDDLPAMDNDALRRGRPSLHKAFDEATAILTGDCLQSFAFECIMGDTNLTYKERVLLTHDLARACGGSGMAGGQMLDLEAEGRFSQEGRPSLSSNDILYLQSMKTGTLFEFASLAGARLGKASKTQRQALLSYGKAFGKAFQIADDLLDVQANTTELGKTAGKDSIQGKGTLVDFFGIEKTRKILSDITQEGVQALEIFSHKGANLKALLKYIEARTH